MTKPYQPYTNPVALAVQTSARRRALCGTGRMRIAVVCVTQLNLRRELAMAEQFWRVKLHYPKRIGSVEYFYVRAATRQEAIASVVRDAQTDGTLDRGPWLKVTARPDKRQAVLVEGTHA